MRSTTKAADATRTNWWTQSLRFWVSALVLWSLGVSTVAAQGAASEDPVSQPSLADAIGMIAAIEQARELGAEGDAGLSLTELLKTHKTTAISVAVVRDYKVHWAKAWGTAARHAGTEADTSTRFQAASISKPVGAMTVLRAVQDGRFGLDDDINALLQTWQLVDQAEFLNESTVTPRLLLSMTAGTTVSGFPGYKPGVPLPSVPQIVGATVEGAERVANTPAVEVGWEPGSKYQYSGGGSTILQLAMSDVLKRPFDDIVTKTVLEPLGMTDSCLCQPVPASLVQDTAVANDLRKREGGHGSDAVRWHVYPELYAAGLWTTPSDLAKFMIEVQLSLDGRSNKVLTKEMVSKMVTPGALGNYALGFTAGSESAGRPAPAGEKTRFFGHTGGNWGFRANFVGSLEGGNGFIIMANSDRANPIVFEELPKRIRSAYGW